MMDLQKLLTILYNSIGDSIDEAPMAQIHSAVEEILIKLEDEGYVKWICKYGDSKCDALCKGTNCPYCERKLLFR